MSNLTALREKIAAFSKLANNLIAEKGSASWSTEEQAQFDGYANDINATKKQISNIETMRELDAEKFFNAAPGKKEEGVTLDVMAAVALYLRNGANMNAEQAIAVRNAMSTTVPAEGGFTVPSEIASLVIDRLRAFGGMREVATILSTDGGNPMNWPTSDGTAEMGSIVGQNAVAPLGELTFGTIALNPFYYTSGQIGLPLELIQDSAIDVIAFVVNRLATRIARVQNAHFTVGTGTTQPDGVIPRAGVGKTGLTGQTLTVTYDDLVDLKHSVNRAYRSNGQFMMNDLSVSVVSKLKETTGRPIWEYSTQLGAPDVLLGKAVVINDDVAVMGANARSIAFGDFSFYNIRDVKNTTVLRRFDDSAFALKNNVGFCGWTRSGGNLLETAAVRVYVNAAA